jgi:hypothetical protein
MCRVPQTSLTVPAVAGWLERGVMRHPSFVPQASGIDRKGRALKYRCYITLERAP